MSDFLNIGVASKTFAALWLGVKSATGNLSDYKRRMALAIRIIVMGANGVEI